MVERTGRFRTQIGSPPSSTTNASATGRSSSGAVTPKLAPSSRSRSSGRPVKVTTGCSASGSTPRAAAGSRTSMPRAPTVRRRVVHAARPRWPPDRQPAAGVDRPGRRGARGQAAATTSSGGRNGTPGSHRSARPPRRVRYPARGHDLMPGPGEAEPSTPPTRPVATIPTRSRAGVAGVVVRDPRDAGAGQQADRARAYAADRPTPACGPRTARPKAVCWSPVNDLQPTVAHSADLAGLHADRPGVTARATEPPRRVVDNGYRDHRSRTSRHSGRTPAGPADWASRVSRLPARRPDGCPSWMPRSAPRPKRSEKAPPNLLRTAAGPSITTSWARAVAPIARVR